MSTLILQSQRSPLPYPFLDRCLASVREWAAKAGFDYQFLGDELFQFLRPEVLEKTRNRILIGTDIARLQWLQHLLTQGYERVVWLDADVLIFAPDALQLPVQSFAVGRETWVQAGSKGPVVHRKVHNAFLQASAEDSALPFYLQSAERLVLANTGGMPDQFVGPKLLTALHNVVQFPVFELVNMLPPSVALDRLGSGGAYLTRYHQAYSQPPAALNLCSSAVASGELSEEQMNTLVSLLLESQSL